MTCIKTGAVVWITNYHGWLVCDLHKVGNVIFANEGTARVQHGTIARPLTHSLTLGISDYCDKDLIIAHQDHWSEIVETAQ